LHLARVDAHDLKSPAGVRRGLEAAHHGDACVTVRGARGEKEERKMKEEKEMV